MSYSIQLYKDGVAITGAAVTVIDAGVEYRKTITDPAREVVENSTNLTLQVDATGDFSPVWIPPKGRWVMAIHATLSTDEGDVPHITVNVLIA